MTITPFALTAKQGSSATLVGHTTDPGVIAVTYPTGITGPTTVTVAGTRVWRNGLKHGQYLARANCLQARVNCAWFVEVDTAKIGYLNGGNSSFPGGLYTAVLASNVRADSTSRINWAIGIMGGKGTAGVQYFSPYFVASSTASSGDTVAWNSAIGGNITVGAIKRFIITSDGANLRWYVRDGIAPEWSQAWAPVGTMGGVEYMVLCHGAVKLAKTEGSIPSQAEREAFMASGTLPAGLAASYQGGHEILPATPRFYDTSGNDLDLSDVDVTYWPEAAASGDYTDTGFTTPAFSIPLTIAADCAAGDHTITLRRTRVGIPSRTPPLSDAELYDDASVTVTVEAADPPCFAIGPDVSGSSTRFPTTRRLTVFSQDAGAVSLASDNAKVQVPASVTVADGFAVFDVSIAGEVSGVTITATQDGETATCDVDLAYAAPAVPEMAANDTLQLFPEWLWTEPHTQGIAAVMDARRAAFVTDLDKLLIYDFANQTSAILDLVAEMFGIYGWNKAAGTTEKVAFLESSLKILRKTGTHYAVKQAIRLVCDAAKIEDITILPGAGNVYDGEHDFDGSINYGSLSHWAKFDVEIETTDATYFTADLQAVIVNMINHYKPASRWLESLIITEI